jgi:hypothetical protein
MIILSLKLPQSYTNVQNIKVCEHVKYSIQLKELAD